MATNLELAARQNLATKAGDNMSFFAEFWRDEEGTIAHYLTVYDAIRLHIKTSHEDTTALVEASIDDGLSLVGANGLNVDIPGSRMQLDPATYVYDVEGSNEATVDTLLEGSISLSADVTR